MVSDFSLDRLSDSLGRAQKWIQDREAKGAGIDRLSLSEQDLRWLRDLRRRMIDSASQCL
jgi:hypothetical protein